MKQKVYPSLDAAVADVSDGARIMFGGFGGAGFPNNLIQALARKGTKNITAISNNCGTREGELGLMFKNNQVKHVIASFPGPHANHFQERYAAKEVTLELVPQGILCERMRAAAAGLTGFYTTVGVGTEVAAGKEERVIGGERRPALRIWEWIEPALVIGSHQSVINEVDSVAARELGFVVTRRMSASIRSPSSRSQVSSVRSSGGQAGCRFRTAASAGVSTSRRVAAERSSWRDERPPC